MIAGNAFKYDNIMSTRYHVVIMNIKTDSNYSNISGTMEYTTLLLPVNNKEIMLGKALKEPFSFEMEIVSDETNVALTERQQSAIRNWLFDREYHKLEIISEEYKDIYFNCYLTESQKIVAGCGVIGYKCKAVCDGLGAWENQKTKSFYEKKVSSYNDTNIHFSMPYTGKMDISVDGNTTETISGIKSSTNQSTLKGVTKVTDTANGQSNVFDIGQTLNKIDSTTFDTANLKIGTITLNTEVKRLLGDDDWEYTEDSINTASGTNLHITDAQSNEHFISLKVHGNQTQNGTGDPSPDNVRPIHGVSKITVNGVDYALSREIFTDDYFDVIAGQGLAHKNKKTLPTTGWIKSGLSTDQYLCAYVPDSSVKADSVIVSEKLASGKYTEGELKEEIGSVNGGAFNICILASRLPSNDIVGLQSFLALNPIEVVNYVVTPQPITGTPISITTTSDMTVTTDNNGVIDASYLNNSTVLYVRHPYSLQKIGLCNRFNYTVMDSQWRNNEEAITVYMNYIYLKVNKTVASDLTALNTWLNSTSVLYVAPLLVPNVINIAPVSSRYLSGVNTMTTDNNGNLHVTLYNNISNNVFVNTSDYNGYMIPNLTVITCGTIGGNISIQNADDVNNHQIIFTGLSPNEVITIDEFGQMQSSTGLNRCDNWNMKRLRLVSGSNHINITGDVVRLDINYQDVRRLGI